MKAGACLVCDEVDKIPRVTFCKRCPSMPPNLYAHITSFVVIIRSSSRFFAGALERNGFPFVMAIMMRMAKTLLVGDDGADAVASM